MNVTTKTVKSYFLEMSEEQARDLLNIACVHEQEFSDSEEETLDAARQALLTAGLTKKE